MLASIVSCLTLPKLNFAPFNYIYMYIYFNSQLAEQCLKTDSQILELSPRHSREQSQLKVARYSFSRSIPPKFERKLRHHKQGFAKIDTTVVLDKEENWL